jgi:hypothetical protein
MPRKDFFTEIRTNYISAECRERRHADCDGYVRLLYAANYRRLLLPGHRYSAE